MFILGEWMLWIICEETLWRKGEGWEESKMWWINVGKGKKLVMETKNGWMTNQNGKSVWGGIYH